MVTYKFTLILFISLLFSSLESQEASSIAVEPPVRIEWKIKDEVVLNKDEILLSDIIETPGNTPIPEIPLGPTPSIERPIHLHQSKIFHIVEKDLPGLLAPKGSGPQWCKISRQHRLFQESEFLETVTQSIDQIFQNPDENIVIKLTRKWRPIPVPDEPVIFEVEDHDKIKVATYGVIRFYLIHNRGKSGPHFVQVRCQKPKEVLVLKTKVNRGETINEQKHSWVSMDTLSIRSPITRESYDPTDLFQASRNLNAGIVLTDRDVKRKPLVSRRSLVTALSEVGKLKISIKALSEEEGYKGDVIKVRNLRSNKEFFAKIIGANLVEPLL